MRKSERSNRGRKQSPHADFRPIPTGSNLCFAGLAQECSGQEAGYRMGFTVDPGFATVGSDLLRIHRTPIFEVPYRNQCFVFRLHFPKLVSMLWHVRIQLIKDGHKEIANYIPTF